MRVKCENNKITTVHGNYLMARWMPSIRLKRFASRMSGAGMRPTRVSAFEQMPGLLIAGVFGAPEVRGEENVGVAGEAGTTAGSR